LKSRILSICSTAVSILLLCSSATAFANQVGKSDAVGLKQLTAYPRVEQFEPGSVRVDFPSLESWPEFRLLKAWLPVEVTLKGEGQPHVGSVYVQAMTSIDFDQRTVAISDLQVLKSQFPDEVPSAIRDELVGLAFRGRESIVPLDVLLRLLPDDFAIPGQQAANADLNFSPPAILVSHKPLRLLSIDREPVKAPIEGTALEYVVNTDWMVFYFPSNAQWYVLNGNTWQQNNYLADGGWKSVGTLPDDFSKLRLLERWREVAKSLPPTIPVNPPVPFVISLGETELVLIDGAPRFSGIAGTGISYVSNTQSDLFKYGDDWYLLVSGRWFTTTDLGGQWRSVRTLPDEFARIPDGHEKDYVLYAVPGTRQAKLALIEAALPHRKSVALDSTGGLQVGWIGEPRFEAIEGTGLKRGLNTPFQVIWHNNFYYLCFEGAWYFSSSPTGAWQVAQRIPDEIYRIPPSDPAYNVTFVRLDNQVPETPGHVNFYYSDGYTGSFSTAVSVVYGTGWHHPSSVYWDPVAGPVYWPYGRTYGYNTVYFPIGAFYGHRYPYFGWWGGYGPYGGWGYGGTTTISVTQPPVNFSQGSGSAWDGPLQTSPGDPAVGNGRSLDAFLPKKQADGTEKFTPTRTDGETAPTGVTASSLYAGAMLSSNRYSGPDGEVYRHEGEQWSQYGEGDWTAMQAIASQQPVDRQAVQAREAEQPQGWVPARKRSLSRSELDRQALARIEGMEQYSNYLMQKEAVEK